MNTPNPLRRRSAAFTLIELLVVIGLIGLLAGGLGVAMKNKNPGSALRSAQSILVSLLSSARAQSALNQVNAMILVQADPDLPNFLRSVKVVVQTTTNSWTEVGGEVVLPEGIYVVPPPNANLAGVTLKSSDAKRLSRFVGSNTIMGTTIGLLDGKYLQSMHLTALGSVSDTGSVSGTAGVKVTGGRMLVAAGNQTGDKTWTLENDSAIRGFVVSSYGVATLINDTATLDY
jgi:prepilin-type N-terminal cleavage/methylation domain-containing protein